MKRLLYGLLCASLLLSACTKEVEESQWEGPVIELSVACLDPTGLTKAGISGVESGEDSYHENVISSVDFFFYPEDATSEPATYHVRYDNLSKRGNAVFRVELSTNEVNYKIFPAQSGITEATVYAVANLPESLMDELDQLEDQENTSMDSIGQLTATTDFVNSQYTNHRQDQFIMSGTTTISLTGRSKKMVAQGMVGLERYASKITVGIKMDNPMAVDTGRKDADDNPIYEYWTPRPQEMQIYLVDGVRKVALSGSPAGKGLPWEPEDADYLSYRDNPMRFYNDAGDLYLDKDGEYFQTFPMYTYPYHWMSGSIEDGSREPYLKLVLPWDRLQDLDNGITSFQREFYYKILIPQDTRGKEYENSFVRNNWYHYDISVGVLGSETDEAAVPLDASLFIVYWQDKDVVVKQVSIGNARYLSVEKEYKETDEKPSYYELNNLNSVDVRYTTSNPIAIENIRVTRPYYGEDHSSETKYGATIKHVSHNDEDTYDDMYPDDSWYLDYSIEQRTALSPDGEDWLLDMGNGVIRYTHSLNNNYTTDDFDYSPYTITFTVRHADSNEAWMRAYDKQVKIVQKPGLYIQALPNPDTYTGVTGKTTPDHWGYVYVNNDQLTRARFDKDPLHNDAAWRLDHIWRVVHYSSGGTDMYRIDVSMLPNLEGFEFVLGDPRESAPVNLREGLEAPYNEPFATAPAIEGGERSLQHYYPTEASERTRHMLAPAYRISTKLSGSEYDGTPLEQAKMRCASLQENGFPAGRWRIPTEAEIRFISNLSAHGVFEWQFGGNYWSANGAVNVDKNSKKVTLKPDVTVALLRCVYDSWYWGDDRVLDSDGRTSIFTWGDKER